MKKPYLTTMCVIVLFAGSHVMANQEDEVSVDCTNIPDGIYDSRFKELRKVAVATNKLLCQSFLQNKSSYSDTVRELLVNYAFEAKSILSQDFNSDDFPQIGKQLNLFREATRTYNLEISGIDNLDLDTMSVGGVPRKLYFSNVGAIQGSKLPTDKKSECAAINPNDNTGNKNPYISCKSAFEDAALAFNAYKFSYNEFRYGENEKKLNYLSQQWDKYSSNARSQTFLDVWLTTLIHRSYYQQNKLVAPASTQYFLFRPQVVYEFSSEAKKGDRNQVGLAAEWFGVNWWDLKIPFGVSAISVYSDYEEESSVGHGLQFTINNNMSIGWVHRGDLDNIFVSVDFLKFWEDKSEKIQQYKEDPLAWIK